ncbi:cAMP-specific 3',5'-cAMP phosphodiesterase 4 [Pelomyxa schiedti]|nr:cAMP-specific 3',5'-cAMP phosphodiesterase 4 [Pelomyxa schiedti]
MHHQLRDSTPRPASHSRTPKLGGPPGGATNTNTNNNSSKRRRGGNADEGEHRLWRGTEWVVVVLFVCCALVAAAGAVVVSVFAVNLVDTISDQTRIYVESTTATVTGPITTFCETVQPSLLAFCRTMADALDTPRIPPASEIATYGYWNYTRPDCPGCRAYATLAPFGGPAEVLFMAQNYNETQVQEIVERYFWRLGAMAPLMANFEEAWVDVVSQMYYIGKNGFSMIYPYFPLFVVQIMDTQRPLEGVADERGFTWVDPYIDQVSKKWVSSVYYSLYDSRIPNTGFTGSLGQCGMDAFVTQIITQVAEMTKELSSGAYVVLVSYDGTLMMIPEAGSADWVSGEDEDYQEPDGTFNYTQILETPNYNLTQWNIFSNSRYQHIAEVIKPTLDNFNSTETYIATIQFATGSRFISWGYVPRSRWIVISVVDEKKATEDERYAMVLMICISTILGISMVVAAGAIGAYSALTRKYAGLTAKIADLSTELDEMKSNSRSLGQVQKDMAAVNALTSGMKDITEALREMSEHPEKGITETYAKLLADARHLLLHRDFKVVKTMTELNSDQKQFVHDCGIEMEHHTTAYPLDLEVGSTGNRETALSLPRAPVTPWAFNVFQVGNTVGQDCVLQSVFYSVLLEEQIPSQFSQVNYKLLMQWVRKLELDYCSDPHPVLSKEPPTPYENPYHNKYHAADVTQAFHSLLTMAEKASPQFSATITPMERLACAIAAASHDYKHPGRNNVFLKNTLHQTFVTFMESPLERSHSAFAMSALLLDPECMPLSGLSAQQQIEIHNLVFKLICATDMAKHVELVDALKAWLPAEGTLEGDQDKAGFVAHTPQGKMLILQLLLKAADISNAYREWEVCQEWTNRLMKEFCKQGADEIARGLPTSKFMDGTASALEMQNSFVPLFVVPLLLALKGLFPNFAMLESQAWDNLNHWRGVSKKPSSSSSSQRN